MILFNGKYYVGDLLASAAKFTSAPVRKIRGTVTKGLILFGVVILMSACGGNSGSASTEGTQGGAGAENNNGSGVLDTASVPTNNNGNTQDSAGFSSQGSSGNNSNQNNSNQQNAGKQGNTPQGNANPSGRMNNKTNNQ